MISLQEKVNTAIDQVVAGIYEKYPDLLERYGENGKKKCREDNQHHFDHLETAYQVSDVEIFINYALWLDDILTVRGMKTTHLTDNFSRIKLALHNNFDTEREFFYGKAIDEAIQALENRSTASRKG